jgi:hypothetical protein
MNTKDMANQLLYSNYTDMEYGNDTETIDYQALISVLTDITNRIEALEDTSETVRDEVLEVAKGAIIDYKEALEQLNDD